MHACFYVCAERSYLIVVVIDGACVWHVQTKFSNCYQRALAVCPDREVEHGVASPAGCQSPQIR